MMSRRPMPGSQTMPQLNYTREDIQEQYLRPAAGPRWPAAQAQAGRGRQRAGKRARSSGPANMRALDDGEDDGRPGVDELGRGRYDEGAYSPSAFDDGEENDHDDEDDGQFTSDSEAGQNRRGGGSGLSGSETGAAGSAKENTAPGRSARRRARNGARKRRRRARSASFFSACFHLPHLGAMLTGGQVNTQVSAGHGQGQQQHATCVNPQRRSILAHLGLGSHQRHEQPRRPISSSQTAGDLHHLAASGSASNDGANRGKSKQLGGSPSQQAARKHVSFGANQRGSQEQPEQDESPGGRANNVIMRNYQTHPRSKVGAAQEASEAGRAEQSPIYLVSKQTISPAVAGAQTTFGLQQQPQQQHQQLQLLHQHQLAQVCHAHHACAAAPLSPRAAAHGRQVYLDSRGAALTPSSSWSSSQAQCFRQQPAELSCSSSPASSNFVARTGSSLPAATRYKRLPAVPMRTQATQTEITAYHLMATPPLSAASSMAGGPSGRLAGAGRTARGPRSGSSDTPSSPAGTSAALLSTGAVGCAPHVGPSGGGGVAWPERDHLCPEMVASLQPPPPPSLAVLEEKQAPVSAVPALPSLANAPGDSESDEWSSGDSQDNDPHRRAADLLAATDPEGHALLLELEDKNCGEMHLDLAATLASPSSSSRSSASSLVAHDSTLNLGPNWAIIDDMPVGVGAPPLSVRTTTKGAGGAVERAGGRDEKSSRSGASIMRQGDDSELKNDNKRAITDSENGGRWPTASADDSPKLATEPQPNSADIEPPAPFKDRASQGRDIEPPMQAAAAAPGSPRDQIEDTSTAFMNMNDDKDADESAGARKGRRDSQQAPTRAPSPPSLSEASSQTEAPLAPHLLRLIGPFMTPSSSSMDSRHAHLERVESGGRAVAAAPGGREFDTAPSWQDDTDRSLRTPTSSFSGPHSPVSPSGLLPSPTAELRSLSDRGPPTPESEGRDWEVGVSNIGECSFGTSSLSAVVAALAEAQKNAELEAAHSNMGDGGNELSCWLAEDGGELSELREPSSVRSDVIIMDNGDCGSRGAGRLALSEPPLLDGVDLLATLVDNRRRAEQLPPSMRGLLSGAGGRRRRDHFLTLDDRQLDELLGPKDNDNLVGKTTTTSTLSARHHSYCSSDQFDFNLGPTAGSQSGSRPPDGATFGQQQLGPDLAGSIISSSAAPKASDGAHEPHTASPQEAACGPPGEAGGAQSPLGGPGLDGAQLGANGPRLVGQLSGEAAAGTIRLDCERLASFMGSASDGVGGAPKIERAPDAPPNAAMGARKEWPPSGDSEGDHSAPSERRPDEKPAAGGRELAEQLSTLVLAEATGRLNTQKAEPATGSPEEAPSAAPSVGTQAAGANSTDAATPPPEGGGRGAVERPASLRTRSGSSPCTTVSELDQDEELSMPSFVDTYRNRLDQVCQVADSVLGQLLGQCLDEQANWDEADGAASGRPPAVTRGSSGSAGSVTGTGTGTSSSTSLSGSSYACCHPGGHAQKPSTAAARARPRPPEKPAHLRPAVPGVGVAQSGGGGAAGGARAEASAALAVAATSVAGAAAASLRRPAARGEQDLGGAVELARADSILVKERIEWQRQESGEGQQQDAQEPQTVRELQAAPEDEELSGARRAESEASGRSPSGGSGSAIVSRSPSACSAVSVLELSTLASGAGQASLHEVGVARAGSKESGAEREPAGPGATGTRAASSALDAMLKGEPSCASGRGSGHRSSSSSSSSSDASGVARAPSNDSSSEDSSRLATLGDSSPARAERLSQGGAATELEAEPLETSEGELAAAEDDSGGAPAADEPAKAADAGELACSGAIYPIRRASQELSTVSEASEELSACCQRRASNGSNGGGDGARLSGALVGHQEPATEVDLAPSEYTLKSQASSPGASASELSSSIGAASIGAQLEPQVRSSSSSRGQARTGAGALVDCPYVHDISPLSPEPGAAPVGPACLKRLSHDDTMEAIEDDIEGEELELQRQEEEEKCAQVEEERASLRASQPGSGSTSPQVASPAAGHALADAPRAGAGGPALEQGQRAGVTSESIREESEDEESSIEVSQRGVIVVAHRSNNGNNGTGSNSTSTTNNADHKLARASLGARHQSEAGQAATIGASALASEASAEDSLSACSLPPPPGEPDSGTLKRVSARRSEEATEQGEARKEQEKEKQDSSESATQAILDHLSRHHAELTLDEPSPVLEHSRSIDPQFRRESWRRESGHARRLGRAKEAADDNQPVASEDLRANELPDTTADSSVAGCLPPAEQPAAVENAKQVGEAPPPPTTRTNSGQGQRGPPLAQTRRSTTDSGAHREPTDTSICSSCSCLETSFEQAAPQGSTEQQQQRSSGDAQVAPPVGGPSTSRSSESRWMSQDEGTVFTENYWLSHWLYISEHEESEIWRRAIDMNPGSNQENSTNQEQANEAEQQLKPGEPLETASTCSERAFSARYKSTTRKMIHRRASIEMYKRIMNNSLKREKRVEISRSNGEFGFRIHGSRPVVVSAIERGTSAETCGLQVGDLIYAINGTNILDMAHSDVVKLAHNADSSALVLDLVPTNDFLRMRRYTQGASNRRYQATVSGHLLRLSPSTAQPLLIELQDEVSQAAGSISAQQRAARLNEVMRLAWRRRYFVLRNDNCLYWYRSSTDIEPYGGINLQGFSASLTNEFNEPAYVIRLVKYGGQPHYLGTNTVCDIQPWIDAINKAATEANQDDPYMKGTLTLARSKPSQIPDPDCAGYLYKFSHKRSGGAHWRAAYFVLKDACLYLFRDQSADSVNQASAVYYLHGYRVRSKHIEHKKHTFELMPPNRKTIRPMFLMAASEIDKKRWIAALEYSIDRWIEID